MSSASSQDFLNLLTRLQSSAAARSTLEGAEPWDTLGLDAQNKPAVIDGFNTASIKKAFNREASTKSYIDALRDAKSYKVALASKLQDDYLAAVERETRMRYRSRIRIMAHAKAKQVLHGLPVGPFGMAGRVVARNLEESV